MIKIKTKEEARVEAEAKCLEMAYASNRPSIIKNKDKFTVKYVLGSDIFHKNFPFADLRNGDLCLIDYSGSLSNAIYNNGKYYDRYDTVQRDLKGIYVDNQTTMITKTGFNILDHLESEQK